MWVLMLMQGGMQLWSCLVMCLLLHTWLCTETCTSGRVAEWRDDSLSSRLQRGRRGLIVAPSWAGAGRLLRSMGILWFATVSGAPTGQLCFSAPGTGC